MQLFWLVWSVSGKTDCPHYAKAELLADCLQQTLPDFSVHKISIVPHEWKVMLSFILKVQPQIQYVISK